MLSEETRIDFHLYKYSVITLNISRCGKFKRKKPPEETFKITEHSFIWPNGKRSKIHEKKTN